MNRFVAYVALASVAMVGAPALAKKKPEQPKIAAGRTPLTPEQIAAIEGTTIAVVADVPKTIAQDAASLPDQATLVKLINAANMTATLSAPGPITVFAPSNEAFSRLAPGTLPTLLKPENLAMLTQILKYHVVLGALTADDLKAKVAAGGGSATLTTTEGQTLIATLASGTVLLTDANGNRSYVTEFDRRDANGVLHVVNGVLSPKL